MSTLTNVIRGSHTVKFEVRVLTEFQEGDDPDGTIVGLSDGDVIFDETGDIFGTADVEVIGQDGQDGPSLFPRGTNQLLAPFGNELFIRYGVDLGGGGILWEPLGYFSISRTTLREESTIRLQCDDRMKRIIDSKLISPRVYTTAQNVGDVFNDLVLEIFPDATIIWDDATDTVPLGREVIAEKSRYKPLKELTEAFGKVMFWDGLGQLRIEAPPDTDVIDWTVGSRSGGVLIDPARMFTNHDIYNAVVVYGEGGDTKEPFKAVAIDADPNSPTRFGGPLGRVPIFFETPLVTTQSQADRAARVLLQRAIGAPYDVEFTSIVNPTLRPRQTVEIIYPNNERDIHIVENIKIPLQEDDPLEVRTRQKAVIVIAAL